MERTEKHYHREHLAETILNRLRQQGMESITRSDLAVVDEFHVRGAEVTCELAAKISITPGMQLLDVGCGIGGPARYLAETFQCNVTGIDLTAEYIRTAEILSVATGQGNSIKYICGNALKLPFTDGTFDVVWTQHVQMNVEDKQQFYSEIFRVLRDEGKFACYEVLSTAHQTISYPVPWAEESEGSYLFTYSEMDTILGLLGMELLEKNDETEKGVLFLEKVINRMIDSNLPALNQKLIMGENAFGKMNNLLQSFRDQKLKLFSSVYRKKVR